MGVFSVFNKKKVEKRTYEVEKRKVPEEQRDEYKEEN